MFCCSPKKLAYTLSRRCLYTSRLKIYAYKHDKIIMYFFKTGLINNFTVYKSLKHQDINQSTEAAYV